MRLKLLGLVLMTQTAPAVAQDGPLVWIDPAHGGGTGVVADGVREEHLALRWGFIVAEAFAEAGYATRMSRTGDERISFQDRVDRAEAAGAELFLSLHFNRNEDTSVWGTQIFLAEDVPAAVAASEHVQAALEEMGAEVALVGQPYPFLKSSTMPTVVIELGHLTHPVERRLLMSEEYWHRAAAALVSAAGRILHQGESGGVIDALAAFFHAIETSDSAALRDAVTDDFEIVEGTTVLDTNGFIRMLEGVTERGISFSYDLSGFNTEVAGASAWARYRNRGVATSPNGERIYEFVESAVLRRVGGRWLLDRLHSSSDL